MNYLLKHCKVIATGSPFDGQVIDILIRDGYIAALSEDLMPPPHTTIFDNAGDYVSFGWTDVGVQLGEPGYEERETLESLSDTALRNGYTTLIAYPNTSPPIHSKSEVSYVLHRSATLPVAILPMGAVSHDVGGIDLAELIDMHYAGAVAFTEGTHGVQDSGLLLRALQYCQSFEGLLLQQPMDKRLAGKGLMHEGIVSTQLGMKGIPALAETTMIQRDLALLGYAGGRLHFSNVSTQGAVEMIRAAKAEGLAVTASVAYMNLMYDHTALTAFETVYKVLPPLREPTDRAALVAAVLDGTLDFISTQHCAWDIEHKDVEFPYAAFGAATLENSFPALSTLLSQIPLETLIQKLTTDVWRVLRCPIPALQVQQKADFTLFATRKKSSSPAPTTYPNALPYPSDAGGYVKAVFTKGKFYTMSV